MRLLKGKPLSLPPCQVLLLSEALHWLKCTLNPRTMPLTHHLYRIGCSTAHQGMTLEQQREVMQAGQQRIARAGAAEAAAAQREASLLVSDGTHSRVRKLPLGADGRGALYWQLSCAPHVTGTGSSVTVSRTPFQAQVNVHQQSHSDCKPLRHAMNCKTQATLRSVLLKSPPAHLYFCIPPPPAFPHIVPYAKGRLMRHPHNILVMHNTWHNTRSCTIPSGYVQFPQPPARVQGPTNTLLMCNPSMCVQGWRTQL